MKVSGEILSELSLISPILSELERKNVFMVPEGYFNDLHKKILKQINKDKANPVFGLNNSLAVPEGYFENLSTNILNKIKGLENERPSEELKKLSILLYSLQGTNVFKVPHDYFNQLSAEISNTIKPQGKVVSMRSKNTVWKIAVAAMMTGVIAVSTLWISQKQNEKETGVAINAGKNIPAAVTPSRFDEDKINEGIAKLSDDDIIKYLQTTGNAVDNEVMTASIDEKDLPAQQDYLLDEKTLQIYLDRIETNKSN